MSYMVKSIFLSLQGEGAQAGARAVFLRFSGCNLWTGREADRAQAQCRFCDTDFVGTNGSAGGRFATPESLADAVAAIWGTGDAHRLVICTGGEPLLQLDPPLIAALHRRGFRVALETNGTLPAPAGIDWVCVSPKAGTRVILRQGDELKLVYPQDGIDPADFLGWDFTHFILQVLDDPQVPDAREKAVAYCLAHPSWRLGLQTHKILNLD